ncbi:MAG: aminoglycoside phosphotransferase family protein [Cyclobacteriaceae bacterium]|nr:aminoglycoside phosphotransferase family protein [Cyclobacteriaceae bacterium]
MEIEQLISDVLKQYDVNANNSTIVRIGSGHINDTFSIGDKFVLQRLNTNIFKKPEAISNNLSIASLHLKKVEPDYLFLEPYRNRSGDLLTRDASDGQWRLFDYIEQGVSVNEISNSEQAFRAAKAFGKLTRLLESSDISKYQSTIEKFHDLRWRWEQFESALINGEDTRKSEGEEVIESYLGFKSLLSEYESLIRSGMLRLHITHNDTKINNVLFNAELSEVICVIDLDTLMPGYFIYDFGDMVRTFASPVSEEEKDYSKIQVRKDVFESTYSGYLSEMGEILSKDELELLPRAGAMMTFVIGLRFLTDYLNGDTYYKTSYPGQNLVRATNQLVLLQHLSD